MNPAIIIPTYWKGNRNDISENVLSVYDHMTPIATEGKLPRCLNSLAQTKNVGRIIILVAAETSIEFQAAERVRSIVSHYPMLNIVVVGAGELNSIRGRIQQYGMDEILSAVSLSSYGAIRNTGLVVASALGHDVAVFIDDDEVIDDPDFMAKALECLTQTTKSGSPILCKTGYYINQKGNWDASSKSHWYDKFWKQDQNFNEWMHRAMNGSRISRAQFICGGCLSVHIAAFSRAPFDPWTTRGEDLDYLLNLRMLGYDVWFDNRWRLRHLPPVSTSETLRFRQDMYRWYYEMRKVEYSKSQIDLLQIKPQSMRPYPGPYLESSVRWRIFITAFLRCIGTKFHRDYFSLAFKGRHDAANYAYDNCMRYFPIAYRWEDLIRRVWKDGDLEAILIGKRIEHSTITASFPAVPSLSKDNPNTDAFAPRG